MPMEALKKVADVSVSGMFPPNCEKFNEDLVHMVEVSIGMDARTRGGTDPRRAKEAAQAYIDMHTRTPGYRIEALSSELIGGGTAVVLNWSEAVKA